jgi:hypothetical protein
MDPLTLAVRENATWCDLVCRLHRLAPENDGRVWWTARRSPDLHPDAVTLDPAATEYDAVGRIHDGPGASVKDSFAALDLTPLHYRVLFDATWSARPPGDPPAADRDGFEVVTEKLPFAAWRHTWGGPPDVLPPGLLRAGGVTVLGRRTPDERYDAGAIAHRTTIGGAAVVGLSNAFGPPGLAARAVASRFSDAWVVTYEVGGVDAYLAALGFASCGPLRVWHRD